MNGERIRREPVGLLYDQWEIGKKYWGMERTVTETDFVMMRWLSGDSTDGPIKKDDGRGNMVTYIHGQLTLIIAQGLITRELLIDGSYISLLTNNITYKKVVLVGDTIRASITPLSKRESKSRPGIGLINFMIEVLNQRDEVVLTNEHLMMIAKSYESAEKNKLIKL